MLLGVMAALRLLLLATQQAAMPATNRTKLLFLDTALFAQQIGSMELEVHRPVKEGIAIFGQHPWESGVYAYHTAVRAGPRDYRLYYDCSSAPALGGKRLTCVALSPDGLSWRKPLLGVSSINGSTQNNVVWPRTDTEPGYRKTHEPGTVFVDPTVPEGRLGRFKMVCTWGATKGSGELWGLQSANGFAWEPATERPIVLGSDTQNVAYWQEDIGKYVLYIRIDLPQSQSPQSNFSCPGSFWDPGKSIRRVGRCVTTNFSDWEGCAPSVEHQVFAFDDGDPSCFDIYTSAASRYEGLTLLFPAVFSHMVFQYTPPPGNDGLVESRIAVSRDGLTAHYPPARNGRAAFLPLGANRCGSAGSEMASYPRGMRWCKFDARSLGSSDFDAAELYASPGILESVDGQWLYLHYGGVAVPHGEGGMPGDSQPNNHSALGRARLRRDGFVSATVGSAFHRRRDDLPGFVTVPLRVPTAAELGCGREAAPQFLSPFASRATACAYQFGGNCSMKPPWTDVRCRSDTDCARAIGEPHLTSNDTCSGKQIRCQTARGVCSAACGSVSKLPSYCDLCVESSALPACASVSGWTPPPNGTAASDAVVLTANVETSVAGFLLAEVRPAGSSTAVEGLSLAEADPVRGNYVRPGALVSWCGGGSPWRALAGQQVALRVAMADTQLYSLEWGCG